MHEVLSKSGMVSIRDAEVSSWLSMPRKREMRAVLPTAVPS